MGGDEDRASRRGAEPREEQLPKECVVLTLVLFSTWNFNLTETLPGFSIDSVFINVAFLTNITKVLHNPEQFPGT
jgi:hypothetical protein